MFDAVCKLGLEGIVSKRLKLIRAVKDLAENPKSKGSGGDTGRGRNILRINRDTSLQLYEK